MDCRQIVHPRRSVLPSRNGPTLLHPWERLAGHVLRALAAKELKALKLDSSEQVLIKVTLGGAPPRPPKVASSLVDTLTSSFMGQFHVTVTAVVRESKVKLTWVRVVIEPSLPSRMTALL